MIMGIQKPAWLESLYTQKFFTSCSIHEFSKKNEKNIYCLDCCASICPHCVPHHGFHRLLQIRRYVYHDVVRMEDLDKLIDCSNVQAYTINSAKVVFIKKRPQNRNFKGSGNNCSSCDRSLQEPFNHCSLGCKVDFLVKYWKDLSPFLRTCNSLQLCHDFEDTENTTPLRSMILDSDEAGSSSSGSSGFENICFSSADFVRKKRSKLYVIERTYNNMYKEISGLNRRKGMPHRSPMC